MQLQTRTNQFPYYKPTKIRWNTWWRLLRPHTLTASFVPVIIGTILALPFGSFRVNLFTTMLLASILIQVATNMFNEYYDYKRGLDNAQSVGIGGAIVRDGVAPRTILVLTYTCLIIALILGLYLCLNSSWWLLPVGVVCFGVGYLYSGGPAPISATPFGELVAGILMGTAIIAISFFIQAGTVTIDALLLSISPTVLIGAILMANNIRDFDKDKNHGRKTLAILVGKSNAKYCLVAMFIFSYAWILLLIAIGIMSPWLLISFLSIPKAVQASRYYWRYASPELLMPGMVATAQTNTLFGLILSLGLLCQYSYPLAFTIR